MILAWLLMCWKTSTRSIGQDAVKRRDEVVGVMLDMYRQGWGSFTFDFGMLACPLETGRFHSEV